MSKFKKKGSGELPKISTASLPDIVFMLLFFFMVATVLRDNTLMIQNTLPAADQIQKLDKKDRVIYIYAGKPSARYQDKYGNQPRIQLNDKFATVGDVGAYILAERASNKEPFLPVNPELGHPENDEYRWMTFEEMESSMPSRLSSVVQWINNAG